jgi:hypothetical protein
VLYHNSYATTAGWIRESTAFAVKTDGDGTELQRTTLAEALNLVDDQQVYYSFRDHTLGLVFLRNSRELVTHGLYAELGEYEFHVFTDFHEIRDDADGTWGRLCVALNGRGVESLEDELRQLQYPELNTSFRGLLELTTSTAIGTAQQLKDTVAAAHRFLTILAKQTGARITKQDNTLTELPAALGFLAAFPALKPSAKASAALRARLALQLESPAGLRILLAWLLLKGRKVQLATYGLDYSLKQTLNRETAFENQLSVQRLQALLALSDGETSAEKDTMVGCTFASSDCRSFMQVHESSGAEWFNKERFEELLEWSAIMSLFEISASTPASRTISTLLGRLATGNQRLKEAAEHAGYRTELTLSLLEPVSAEPVIKPKPGVAAPKKPARKKSDVQSSPRTNTAKTPDHKVPR